MAYIYGMDSDPQFDAGKPLEDDRRERFVQLLAGGLPKWRAWQESQADTRRRPRRQTATTESVRVIAEPHVSARLARLRDSIADIPSIVSRQEMLELASQGARDTDQPLRDRLAALALIARCQAYDIPVSETIRPDGLNPREFAALVLTAKADAAANTATIAAAETIDAGTG